MPASAEPENCCPEPLELRPPGEGECTRAPKEASPGGGRGRRYKEGLSPAQPMLLRRVWMTTLVRTTRCVPSPPEWTRSI
jgi:hypothetical protein